MHHIHNMYDAAITCQPWQELNVGFACLGQQFVKLLTEQPVKQCVYELYYAT